MIVSSTSPHLGLDLAPSPVSASVRDASTTTLTRQQASVSDVHQSDDDVEPHDIARVPSERVRDAGNCVLADACGYLRRGVDARRGG